MSLFRQIEKIKAQIVDTERLLEMVIDHPLMAESLKVKLFELKEKLSELPKEYIDPKIQILFSGSAVKGSEGIKTTFLGKTLSPLQQMIKTQAALVRFGNVGRRGQIRKGPNTDLYLTALPAGSFGIELSQLDSEGLFDGEEVSNAMKQVIEFIKNASEDDAIFEKAIENTPKRNLTNLRRFLKEVSDYKSVIKMECGEVGIEITEPKVYEAYKRVSETINEEEEIFVTGIFRGLLLDSGKFEMQDAEGMKKSGFISEEISEDELVEYDKSFLNTLCTMHLKVYATKFKSENIDYSYELLGIRNADE